MMPIVVFWTKYTAVSHGRVLKLVPCENCSIEFVYELERAGTGVGTSVYALNDDGAESHAVSAAKDTLQSYLENDFDAVPCPSCGYYQRYMFPKLKETKSLWGPLSVLVLSLVSCLDAVAALYWIVVYMQRPNDYAFVRMVATSVVLPLLCFIVLGLLLAKQSQDRRFDPNLIEPLEDRLAKGQRRAVARSEFDRMQQKSDEACRGSHGGNGRAERENGTAC